MLRMSKKKDKSKGKGSRQSEKSGSQTRRRERVDVEVESDLISLNLEGIQPPAPNKVLVAHESRVRRITGGVVLQFYAVGFAAMSYLTVGEVFMSESAWKTFRDSIGDNLASAMRRSGTPAYGLELHERCNQHSFRAVLARLSVGDTGGTLDFYAISAHDLHTAALAATKEGKVTHPINIEPVLRVEGPNSAFCGLLGSVERYDA